MEKLFELVTEQKNNLKDFFKSNEWLTIDLNVRLKSLERFFNLSSWTHTRKDIFLEIIREIEVIKSTLSSRPCACVIPNYSIDTGIYTDNNNIYINFDIIIEYNTSYIEALYQLNHAQIRLDDYNNVMNGDNSNRTNEIRLNLVSSKLYIDRNYRIGLKEYQHNSKLKTYRTTFLLHNYQPIEYYAYPDALKKVYECFQLYNVNDPYFESFQKGQLKFERVITEDLNELGIDKEDVKRGVLEAAKKYIAAKDQLEKDRILEIYYVTGYIPQLTKKL